MPSDPGNDPNDDRSPAAIGARSTRAPRGDVRPLIVVGFDGSEGAARAIAAITTLVAGAEALVVCVYRPVRDVASAALLWPPQVVAQAKRSRLPRRARCGQRSTIWPSSTRQRRSSSALEGI
jgi:hypothetical protein